MPDDFLLALISYLTVVPAAVLCIAPMRNRLRYRLSTVIKLLSLILAVTIPGLAWLTVFFKAGPNTFFFPLLIILFFIFHRCLTVHISKTLAVFAYVCMLMALISNYATGFDAVVNPDSGANTFSAEGSVFQLAISIVATALFIWPFHKYGSIIIDSLERSYIWYTVSVISLLILGVCIRIRPLKYETLYTNRVFETFWFVLAALSSLIFLLTIVLYFIVSEMLKKMELADRAHILEMRESLYLKQQNYMESTSRQRHDFRQTIHALENLAKEGNLEAVRSYLDDFENTMPQNDIISFCGNSAVNAVLNYYHGLCKLHDIHLRVQADIPANCSVPDPDLCSVTGNLLENAGQACKEMTSGERYITLTIAPTENAAYLCIVMTNPYTGKLRKSGGHYISTRRNGTGIGLRSIASIAEQYGGVAKFSDRDGEFYSDVMLRLN
ncbi:MAG: GHKL domain-containing protein [Lachnospiraceae bacterium]|nr:GHKL domain-containing protein [Lachnospiraceae bacterium]